MMFPRGFEADGNAASGLLIWSQPEALARDCLPLANASGYEWATRLALLIKSKPESGVSSPGICPTSILKTSLGRRKACARCGSLIVFRRPFSHTAVRHVRTGADPFHVQIIDF